MAQTLHLDRRTHTKTRQRTRHRHFIVMDRRTYTRTTTTYIAQTLLSDGRTNKKNQQTWHRQYTLADERTQTTDTAQTLYRDGRTCSGRTYSHTHTNDRHGTNITTRQTNKPATTRDMAQTLHLDRWTHTKTRQQT